MDKHLNLFYTYDQDNQLVENNLTRALIVCLRFLGGNNREKLLKTLLARRIAEISGEGALESLGFERASFALQGHIDARISRGAANKYLLVISSKAAVDLPESANRYDSVPDAWIFDANMPSYVFLVEAKVGTNMPDVDQLHSHASRWLDIDDLASCIIAVSWLDVLRTANDMLAQDNGLNQQEKHLLADFISYLGFFGYRLLRGFHLTALRPEPHFRLVGRSVNRENAREIDLKEPPAFRLTRK